MANVKFDRSVFEKECLLTNVIKGGEEMGEVNDEILKYLNYQRKDKLGIKKELSHEIAGVTIATGIYK